MCVRRGRAGERDLPHYNAQNDLPSFEKKRKTQPCFAGAPAPDSLQDRASRSAEAFSYTAIRRGNEEYKLHLFKSSKCTLMRLNNGYETRGMGIWTERVSVEQTAYLGLCIHI